MTAGHTDEGNYLFFMRLKSQNRSNHGQSDSGMAWLPGEPISSEESHKCCEQLNRFKRPDVNKCDCFFSILFKKNQHDDKKKQQQQNHYFVYCFIFSLSHYFKNELFLGLKCYYPHVRMIIFLSLRGFLSWPSANSIWRWSTLFRLSTLFVCSLATLRSLFKVAPDQCSCSRLPALSSWAAPGQKNPATHPADHLFLSFCVNISQQPCWHRISRQWGGCQTDIKSRHIIKLCDKCFIKPFMTPSVMIY